MITRTLNFYSVVLADGSIFRSVNKPSIDVIASTIKSIGFDPQLTHHESVVMGLDDDEFLNHPSIKEIVKKNRNA